MTMPSVLAVTNHTHSPMQDGPREEDARPNHTEAVAEAKAVLAVSCYTDVLVIVLTQHGHRRTVAGKSADFKVMDTSHAQPTSTKSGMNKYVT